MILLFSTSALPPRAIVAQALLETATVPTATGTANAKVAQTIVEAITSRRPNATGQPEFVIVGHLDVVPAPTLVAVVQAGTYAKAVVALPPTTGREPITLLRLYRAPTSAGPWSLVDAVGPSPISAYNHLFDLDPPIGRQTFYAATAVDPVGLASSASAALSLSAQS